MIRMDVLAYRFSWIVCEVLIFRMLLQTALFSQTQGMLCFPFRKGGC